MKNVFLKKIHHKQPCLGTFCFLTNGNAVEALSYTGLDFIIIDAEHGTAETETVENLVRAAKLHDLTPFVRAKDCSRPAILKMLEAGAHGLLIPQIRTVEEVKNLVAYAKYYPVGVRGVAVGINGGYGYARTQEAVAEKYTAMERIVAETAAAASRYGADTSAAASRYGADTSAAASRYGADTSAAASRYGADKHYEGTKYSSDRSAAASRYGSELMAGASRYGSEQAASASRYASDNAYNASKYGNDTQWDLKSQYGNNALTGTAGWLAEKLGLTRNTRGRGGGFAKNRSGGFGNR